MATGPPTPPAPPAPANLGNIQAEVDAELIGQISPLETEAAGYGRAEDRAVSDLNALFAGLMPFVAGSAQRVAQSYGATSQAQTSIFNQAWARLNSLRGERAADAQALAQQLGAPIPIEAFTTGTEGEMGAFVPEAAGEMLKATTIGQAGVQEAEAFAGRVFPLKRARMERETRQYYRDKITDIKKQITALKAMKPGLVNERLRQRQLEDYEMKLARYQSQFEQWSTKKSLALEEKRLSAQIEEIRGSQAVAEAGVGLEQQRINLTKQQQQAGNTTYVNNQKQNIIAGVNAMVTPGSNLTDIKRSEWRQDPNTGEWKLYKWTETRDLRGDPVRNPTKLLSQVMAQLGISKKQKVLYNFAVAQIVRSLRASGYPGIPSNPGQWNKWWNDQQQRKASRQAANATAAGIVPGQGR